MITPKQVEYFKTHDNQMYFPDTISGAYRHKDDSFIDFMEEHTYESAKEFYDCHEQELEDYVMFSEPEIGEDEGHEKLVSLILDNDIDSLADIIGYIRYTSDIYGVHELYSNAQIIEDDDF